MSLLRKLLLIFISALISLNCFAGFAKGDATAIIVNLDIEGPDSSLFNGPVDVTPCATPNNATSTVNGFCAFVAAGLSVDATWYPSGAMVNSINSAASDASNYWLWFLNGDVAQEGIDSYQLKQGDNILWTLKREPLKFSASRKAK